MDGPPERFAYHAASVRAPTRILVITALAVLVPAAACTKGDGGGPTDTPTAAPTSPTHVGPVRFQPGEYRYAFGGVTASLSFAGSTATMEVKNASGTELAPPGVYVVDGKGERHDGTVVDAATIPDRGTATFQVTFPSGVTPKTIGLVILEFGDSDWGAFAPAPAA